MWFYGTSAIRFDILKNRFFSQKIFVGKKNVKTEFKIVFQVCLQSKITRNILETLKANTSAFAFPYVDFGFL